MKITKSQMTIAYKKLQEANPSVNTALSIEEIADIAKTLSESDEFARTEGSAMFILTRMHVLIEGMAPYGVSEKRAETLFMPSTNMVEFVEELGYDADIQIANARKDLQQRPVKVKRPDAVQIMADYYKDNKDDLPKSVVKHREVIIDCIMNGMSVEESFVI